MTIPNLPQPNIPLLRKAVEWAEAEAAKTDGTCLWDQGSWAEQTDCGTTYCIAGYTVLIALPQAEMREREDENEPGLLDLYVDGERAWWSETAASVLGITREECLDLFEADNSIADVRLFAEQIAARAGERL
jgi:hypothetical protein